MKRLCLSLALLIGLSSSTSILMAPPENTPPSNNSGSGWHYGLVGLTFVGFISLIAWKSYTAKKKRPLSQKSLFEKCMSGIINWLDGNEGSSSTIPTNSNSGSRTTSTPNNNPNHTNSAHANNQNYDHPPQHNNPTSNTNHNAAQTHVNTSAHNQTTQAIPEEEPHCPICFKEFGANVKEITLDSCLKNKDGKVMHSFCEQCINNWYTIEKNKYEADKEYYKLPPCPVCEKGIKLPKKEVNATTHTTPLQKAPRSRRSQRASLFNPYGSLFNR